MNYARDERSGDGGEIDVGAPGGWRLRFTRIDTKIVLLALLITVCFGMSVRFVQEGRKADDESKKAYLEQHKITQNRLSTVIANETAILDSIRMHRAETHDDVGEMTYMLTLNQQQREALRMQMPTSLRKKLNER